MLLLWFSKRFRSYAIIKLLYVISFEMFLIQSRKSAFCNIMLLNLLALILYRNLNEVLSSKKGLIWTFKGESEVLVYTFEACKLHFPFKRSCSHIHKDSSLQGLISWWCSFLSISKAAWPLKERLAFRRVFNLVQDSLPGSAIAHSQKSLIFKKTRIQAAKYNKSDCKN